MLPPTMFIGLGAVAVWLYTRYPRLRPRSLARAAAHVAVSFFSFSLLPVALHVLLPLAPSAYVVLALLIPALTYLLFSWVWLIARILHELFRGPRGGHPVATDH